MTTEQKFNCIFCKDVFDDKAELQVHFRKHADPEFKSKSRFASDAQMTDDKDKEKCEMVSCDVCPQMFPTISKAITHKHKVHPDHDIKYFCPWCGKLFTMKHPYNIHVQNSHEKTEQIENKTFHCDCCDVDFFLPIAMIYHNKFFHRQDTDVPDVGMSKKLRLYNQEAIQLYYCAFCGEEYENKVNLYKHITDDHCEENQNPKEVLRCPLCEAIFYHLDAYEIHLVFHTTDDLYSTQNDLFAGILDFSLETVPPMIEKVDTTEDFEAEAHSQDTDAELNESSIGIEKFLELAMDQPEDSNPGKVKKKKHKKSKKAAITLDEFLSMNQDVFGEDLDFQGVEELPTRVVKKRVRNNKKSANTVASAELEKLKQKGIVVVKVDTKKSKTAQKKIAKKTAPIKELKTSSEVLTKLINQSNNQIKIVKKSGPNMSKNEVGQDIKTTSTGQNTSDHDVTSKFEEKTAQSKLNEADFIYNKEDIPQQTNIKKLSASKLEDIISPSPSTVSIINKNTELLNAEHDIDNIITKESNGNDIILERALKSNRADISQKLGVKNDELEQLNTINTINKHLNHPQPKYKQLNNEMIDKQNVTVAEDIQGSDEQIDETQNSSNKHNEELNRKPLVSSLSTLKHLSHLTVKPINRIKTSLESVSEKVADIKNSDKSLENADEDQAGLDIPTDNDVTATKSKAIIDKDPTLDALKILSKNITIKSLSGSTNTNVESESDIYDDTDEVDETIPKVANRIQTNDIIESKNIPIKRPYIDTNEGAPTTKVITMGNRPPKNVQSLKPMNKLAAPKLEVQPNKNIEDFTPNNPLKTNILKNLPNITTKSIPSKLNVQSQEKKTILCTKTNNQEVIEISDIDDSDNETDYFVEPEPKQKNSSTSVDPLKNLSKHITVKSLNHPIQSVLKNIKVEKGEEQSDDDYIDHLTKCDYDIPKACSQKLSNKNTALKNALKYLGKNITVKPGTSSPCQSNKSQDLYSQDSTRDVNGIDDEIDSDMLPPYKGSSLKITELEETDVFNHEDSDENFEFEHSDNQPIVESPHDSDNENDEVDDALLDFETEINASAVMKTNQEIITNKNTLCLNNLKNISKNLTIKSLSTNSAERQDKPKLTVPPENFESAKTPTKQSPVKIAKPFIKEPPEECTSTSRNLTNATNVTDHSSNESLNQKVSVNKEVTVKTFQTKTVIQEITTTVTKTIKTVNQTVKQETRNCSQMSIPVMPQKVQGMRPSTSKNLQGVIIRQAAPPAVRPNINMSQTRPATPIVRPVKQMVPTRPRLNVTRPTAPRMPNTKTNLPKTSPNKQVMGKPLKFSPSAMMSTSVKRPNVDDVTGPFSCFKKPKESLIPGSDSPAFAGGGEGMMQVKSASHTSSSYMRTSQIIKGNSIVTATQMKSEQSSMQQLSRLNNSIGIKVKSAPVKQSQVQDSEPSFQKRTTLEAIEKLQKQGLLVKKPRLERNEDDDINHSMGYGTDDEPDE